MDAQTTHNPPIIDVRPATLADLPSIISIHSHYVAHSVITFALEPTSHDAMLEKMNLLKQRRLPFLVAVDIGGGLASGAEGEGGSPAEEAGNSSLPDSLAVAAAAVARATEQAMEQGIHMDLDTDLDLVPNSTSNLATDSSTFTAPHIIHTSTDNDDPSSQAPWPTNETIIGYTYVSPFRSGLGGYRHTVELSLFCHPSYTSRGAGSLLLRRMIDILRNPGSYGSDWTGGTLEADKAESEAADEGRNEAVEEVLAVMALDNTEGGKGYKLRDWYERFGFKQVGHLKRVGRKFDKWIDTIYLQLSIHEHEEDAIVDPASIASNTTATQPAPTQTGKRRSGRRQTQSQTQTAGSRHSAVDAPTPTAPATHSHTLGEDGDLMIDPELQNVESPQLISSIPPATPGATTSSNIAASSTPSSTAPIPPISPSLNLNLRFATRHEAREYINQISMRLGFTVRFSHYSKGKGRAYIDCTRGGAARFRKLSGEDGDDDGEEGEEGEGEDREEDGEEGGDGKSQVIQNLNQADKAGDGATYSSSIPKTKTGRRRGQSHRIGCPFRLILKENRPETESDYEMDLGLGLVAPPPQTESSIGQTFLDPNIDPALVDAAAAAAEEARAIIGAAGGSAAGPSTSAFNPRKRGRSSLNTGDDGTRSHTNGNGNGNGNDDEDSATPGVYWTIAILRDSHSHAADPPSSLPAARRFTAEDLKYIEAAYAAKQKPRAMLKHFRKRNHPALAKDLYNVLSRMKKVKKEKEEAEAEAEGLAALESVGVLGDGTGVEGLGDGNESVDYATLEEAQLG